MFYETDSKIIKELFSSSGNQEGVWEQTRKIHFLGQTESAH